MRQPSIRTWRNGVRSGWGVARKADAPCGNRISRIFLLIGYGNTPQRQPATVGMPP